MSMKIGGELSKSKKVKTGVRQGCVTSLDLFNIIYSEKIITNLERYPTLTGKAENINNTRYADDITIISALEKDI